ncbi:MAG TPA: SIMPL domain-containing protein [Dehalococcoidia bacterium]|nr:SIMPL domain-containing protein [Dehalococcoidia bacterium]
MGWKSLIIFLMVLFTIALGAAGCESLSPPSSAPSALSQVSGILNQQNTGIWVTGEGKVSVVPDVAILNLGVESQAESVATAQSQAATAMAAVVAELDRFDIADKDIKTQYFSITPVRRWSEKDGQEILIGYRVTNTVTVKVRKIEDTGPIIDAAAVAGGDYIRINNISFTVDDPSAYYDDARVRAMADASEKAKQLADLANVKLGKPTYINESGVSTPVVKDFYPEAAIPAPAAPTPISPGETEISISVQVTYSIE